MINSHKSSLFDYQLSKSALIQYHISLNITVPVIINPVTVTTVLQTLVNKTENCEIL